MTSRRRSWFAGLIAFATLAATGCGSPSADSPPAASSAVSEEPAAATTTTATSEAVTLQSDDGLLTVDFPAGSLPEGVQPTLRTLQGAPAELPAYEIGPLGIDLVTPATVELRIDGSTLTALDVERSDDLPRQLVLAADGVGQLPSAAALIEQTELAMQADLIRLSTVYAAVGGGGPPFRFEQMKPGPETPVDTEFEAEVGFTDEAGDPVEVLESKWYLDANLTTPNPVGRCPSEPSEFFGLGVFVIDAKESPILVEVPVTTGCVEQRVEVELNVLPPLFGGEVYEGSAYLRAEPDGRIGFGFPADALPDGGTIGLDVVDLDGMNFLECLFERRDSQPQGALCVLRDASFLQVARIDMEETTEEMDGELIVWATEPEALGEQLLEMFLDRFGLDELGLSGAIEVSIRRYLRDGTLVAATIDPADPALAELAGGLRQQN